MNRNKIRSAVLFLLALVMMIPCAMAESEAPFEVIEEDEPIVITEEEWAAIVAQDADDLSENSDLPVDWWNILLLGCDSYTKNDYQRTDSMIIVSVNQDSGEVKLTSLLRDTWITVPGTKNSKRKLTELCALGGPELTMRAINQNFGMNITDYALISMEGIAEIIDLIGGLELDVTEAERKALNQGLFDLSALSGMEKLEQSGTQVHLNGNQATAFARIRKIDNDYVRTERQRTVLLTMARKIKNGASTATLLAVVDTLLDYVDTNMSLTDIMTIGTLGLTLDLSSISEFRIPADGHFDAGTFGNVWCIKPDFEANTQLLYDFIYG